MQTNFDQVLDKAAQSALADEVVATAAAVVSNASAPDFAAQVLAKSREQTLAPEQRAAAAAMQAYGMDRCGDVFTVALNESAVDRAASVAGMLKSESAEAERALLESEPDVGVEFKSRLCRGIAAKCAELVAAEVDRQKKGPLTILDPEDQKVFTRQHEEHQQQRSERAIAFLSSLPRQYPSFGAALFASIRSDVQQQIEETYKSPDVHTAVADLFNKALEAMPPEVRRQVPA